MPTVLQENARPLIEAVLEINRDGFITARDLYKWLDLSPAHYARWVKKNILDNPFAKQGLDYKPVKLNHTVMGRPSQDYRLTFSFAKKLATILRNGFGEHSRTHFSIKDLGYGLILEKLDSYPLGYSNKEKLFLFPTEFLLKTVEKTFTHF